MSKPTKLEAYKKMWEELKRYHEENRNSEAFHRMDRMELREYLREDEESPNKG